MIWRDFVELTRDAVQALAFGLEGERDLTPMLYLESELGVSVIGVDPEFFRRSATVRALVMRYVLPLLAESQARKLAWSYCAWIAPGDRAVLHDPATEATQSPRPSSHPGRQEILLATFIDPEVIEHWAAPLIRTGGPVLVGSWCSALGGVDSGPMLTTIQESLR